MQMLQQSSKRRALRHLSKGIHILWEALATVVEPANELRKPKKVALRGVTIMGYQRIIGLPTSSIDEETFLQS